MRVTPRPLSVPRAARRATGTAFRCRRADALARGGLGAAENREPDAASFRISANARATFWRAVERFGRADVEKVVERFHFLRRGNHRNVEPLAQSARVSAGKPQGLLVAS